MESAIEIVSAVHHSVIVGTEREQQVRTTHIALLRLAGRLLLRHGCSMAQGYYDSCPVSRAALLGTGAT